MRNIPSIKIAERIDWKKIGQDITVLRALKDFATKNGFRPVVSGGYGLDLFLNITTRSHGDIDVIVYSTANGNDAASKLSEFFKGLFPDVRIETDQEEFYIVMDVNAEGFGADIYCVQTVQDPHIDLNKIIKSNGQLTENNYNKFPKPLLGRMGKFEIEVQDQNAHLADILLKLDKQSPAPKYEQDIENLKHITDPKKVDSLLVIH